MAVEYISREAAKKAFCEYCDWAEAESEYCQSCPDPIGRIPAADVVSVVRAENVGKDYAECDQFVCSKCGIELQDWHRVERDEDDGEVTYHEYVFRFCPNCGARMDGDGE